MRLDPIERWNLGISAAAIVASLALVSTPFAMSLALGVAIEAANFRALRAAARRLLGGDVAMGRAWSAGFALRFALLGAGIAFALRSGAHPVGLVIGLSTIIPAVVIGAWLMRPPISHEPGAAPDDPSWDRWNPWLARERDPEEDD